MIKIFKLIMITITLVSMNAYSAETVVSKPWYKYINASLAISEMQFVSQNDQYEFDWGLELSNANQDKFEVDLTYAHSYSKNCDPYTKATFREVSLDYGLEIDVNNIWKIIGYTSTYSLNQQLENSAYTTKYDISAAPLGIKLDLYKSDLITSFTLSFLPTYAYLETDDQDEDDNGNPIIVRNVERSLNKVVRFEFAVSLLKGNLTIGTDAQYTKVTPYDESIEDERDYTFTNVFKVNYSLMDHISLSYSNKLDYDDRRRKMQNTHSTIHTNTFAVSFDWNP